MAGLPKKPAQLRRGHGGTRDVVLREELPEQIPTPPRGLLAKSRKRWAAYWGSQIARVVDPVADLHRVERWIHAVDEYERCLPVLKKTRMVLGSAGQVVMNPLAGYIAQLNADIARAENDLGLTPIARMRLGIAYQEARRGVVREIDQREQQEQPAEEDPRRLFAVV